jgi:hypothetical protein
MPPSPASPGFFTWRDYVLTPLLEGLLLAAAFGAAVAVHRACRPELFVLAAVFYAGLMVATTLFLAALRRLWPPVEGASRWPNGPGTFTDGNFTTFFA